MTLFARAVPNGKHHLLRMQKRALGDQPSAQTSEQQAGQQASQQAGQTSNNVFKADQPQTGQQSTSSESSPNSSSPDR